MVKRICFDMNERASSGRTEWFERVANEDWEKRKKKRSNSTREPRRELCTVPLATGSKRSAALENHRDEADRPRTATPLKQDLERAPQTTRGLGLGLRSGRTGKTIYIRCSTGVAVPYISVEIAKST